MASSRRTYNTDTITLRTIFAKDGNNSNIPAQRVLTADGVGGTYWAIPSTLGLNGGFNQIVTSAGNYTADLSYNTFRLSSGPGIGMTNGPTGSNQTNLFAKAFQQIDLSGGNLLAAFSNGYLYPTLKIAGEGSIQVRSDPTNNTFFIHGPMTVNTVSTGIYGFSQLQVIPSISTPISNANKQFGYYLTATSPSTLLTFAGINDIQLSTNVTTNTVFMSISSFTSKGYLALSGETFGAYGRATSTMSTNYVDKSTFVTTISSLSTNFGGISNVLFSTISWLALSTGLQFYTLTGLINARATIVQLNDSITTISQQQTSTVKGLGSAGYISSIVISPSSITSTVQGLGTAGYISSLSLISTTQGLQYGYQTSGFVSSPNLIGHVSTAYLNTTLASTVQGLGTAGYLSTASGGSVPSNLTLSTLIVSSTTLVGGSIATNEKGLTWSQSGSISTTWTAISPQMDNTGNTFYACVNGGYIYYTTNNGATWTQQATVQAWSGISGHPNTGIAIATVAGGGIYYTADSGTTWTLSSAPTANWSCVGCITNNNGYNYACINGGGIYISISDGATWSLATAPTKNWVAISCTLTQPFFICSGSTSPLFSISLTDYTTIVATSSSSSVPSGNWNSISAIGYGGSSTAGGTSTSIFYPYFILIGRNDGANYSYSYSYGATAGLTTVTALPVRGYVGQLYGGSVGYCALPNNPIQVSYNKGVTWVASSSPSLNWSCMSPVVGAIIRLNQANPNINNALNNSMMVGTVAGYIWRDLPNGSNTYTNIIAGHNTSIGSDGVVNVYGNEINLNGIELLTLTGQRLVFCGDQIFNGTSLFNGNATFSNAITVNGNLTTNGTNNFQGLTNFTGVTTNLTGTNTNLSSVTTNITSPTLNITGVTTNLSSFSTNITGALTVTNTAKFSSITTSSIISPWASLSSIINISSINGAIYPPASGGSVPSNLTISTLTVSSFMSGLNIIGANKGLNWSQSSSGSRNWTSITGTLSGAGIYYACVNGGYIYKTTDGGVSWTQQATVQAWTSISATFGFNTAVACIAGGGIYYTPDGGTTWILSSASTGNWTSVSATITTNNYIASINGGGIYYSSDSGATWTLSGAPTGNWSAIQHGGNGSYCVAVRTDTSTPIWYSVGNGSGSWSIMSSSSALGIGNWNSISVTGSGGYYNYLLIGRNDGFNYLATGTGGSSMVFTVLPVRGYVGQPSTGGTMYCAFPNTPISISYNNGVTWFPSNSPSLNWSCICPLNLPINTSLLSAPATNTNNPMFVGVSSGFIWGDVPDSTNPITSFAGHVTNIGSDNNQITMAGSYITLNANNVLALNSVGGAINITSANSGITLTGGTNGTTNTGVSFNMRNPANSAYVRQPFIQYGTATGLTGATGSTIVTLTYAYTSQTSFVPTATVANFPPAMVFTSTITSGTFMIGWSSIATGSQAFYWNTMGT